MLTTEQDPLAKEIIQKVRAETQARAVLERPRHAPWMMLFAFLMVCVVTYLVHRIVPVNEIQETLLSIVSVLLACHMVDSWQDRRRLEAAITLLKLRDKTG